ncbi:sulfate/molybdate ABC transporter ATP-binding protein [Desulfurispirillum indicum]|uniref:Sulfate ABC transporter, ATPase subunit n=1 Tax=Desulfurispirillum indicum (strain ATCC BAA-1389 / DSM 22839 / S5) TaxID=653733 RepID=E6W332_DESIS|nr:sulfate/molybdate ABC transporter ATP-binding protein [Desulfurispirillum indicum]ADU65693.1 sulfate ABC transporter, ATPase subunit [Desulfurispirillum indicum S5]UCZ57468.1 sulfate/molybdate ABC transporter ATP-binding protein [Desulfurispirillum indicum]
MSIRVTSISKKFHDFVALDNLSLELPEGQLTALLGPSGSGKTTLLRIIAGLELPDSGQIEFFGQDQTNQHVSQRGVGFVFQHYALFKHMSVFENVAYGLKVKPRHERPDKATIRKKVMELLDLVQLGSTADRYPAQLSGGQRQRIALARALAVEPRVLLLDEPFGALDAKVRAELRSWLRRLHDEIHLTSIFVTHDQEEALEVADRIVVMNQGKVEQEGSPDAVYENPANPFVYQFLGNVNLFHGRVRSGHLEVEQADIGPTDMENARAQDDEAAVYVRPHDVEITLQNPDHTGIEARITYLRSVGPVVRLELQTLHSGRLVEAHMGREAWRIIKPVVGDRVFVHLRNAQVYAKEGVWGDYVI